MSDPGDLQDYLRRLRIEALKFRDGAELKKSPVMHQLFDYLLERSLAGEAPKEVEIALALFEKPPNIDTLQDTSVRVHIHRLRRRLEEHYAAPRGCERLILPRGSYRLQLEPSGEATDTAKPCPAPPAQRPPARFGRRALLAGAVGGLAVSLGLVGMRYRGTGASSAALMSRQFPWDKFPTDRPLQMVLGDYFIFGELSAKEDVTRLVREFDVNSSRDLHRMLAEQPERASRVLDLDLHYLPIGTGDAVASLAPVVAALRPGSAGSDLLTTVSKLDGTTIKNRNLVFVGYFSSLGILRDPLFAVSRFAPGENYDDLIDKRTGRSYVSDRMNVVGNALPERDFGYLALLPGPSGTYILIVAGTRDAGLAQAADIARDSAELTRICEAVGGERPFEALYEVRTMGDTNLGAELVGAYPIQATHAWTTKINQAFPDE